MKSSAELFTECWHIDGPRVLAFARRHVGDEHAHDVVAETFMIAWRRWDKVSEPPIGWLILTAKGVIRNRLRTNRRQSALVDRVSLLGHVAAPDISDAAIGREEALERLGALSEEHREALLLTSWDGLTSEQAAEPGDPGDAMTIDTRFVDQLRPAPQDVVALLACCSSGCRPSWRWSSRLSWCRRSSVKTGRDPGPARPRPRSSRRAPTPSMPRSLSPARTST